MAITHNWEVKRLIQLNDDTGTVCQVDYRVVSTEDDFEVINGGKVILDVENIENFISYSDLNEEMVLEWVKSKLSQKSVDHEADNVKSINSIKNPPKPKHITERLPWNQPQTTVETVVESTEPTVESTEPVVE